MTMWMLYLTFADKGDNPLANLNKYNVDGDKRLFPSLQHLATGSVLKIIYFLFFIPEIILLTSTKWNYGIKMVW